MQPYSNILGEKGDGTDRARPGLSLAMVASSWKEYVDTGAALADAKRRQFSKTAAEGKEATVGEHVGPFV